MAPKSYKKRRSLRNVRKSRKRQQGGADGGATGYVAGVYGDLQQQMAGADAHNLIQPMQSQTSMGPAQIGGRRKSKRRRQKGGLAPLQPADLSEPHSGGQHMDMSAGQKGGYFPALLERAVVPFGLIGLQRMMGKRARSAKKSNFRKSNFRRR